MSKIYEMRETRKKNAEEKRLAEEKEAMLLIFQKKPLASVGGAAEENIGDQKNLGGKRNSNAVHSEF